MKSYEGWRDGNGICHIKVIEGGERNRVLDPRNDLYNHSPDGFEWGYGGSGPAQTALALLADALGDDRRAVELHQEFKRRVVEPMGREGPWRMGDALICQIVGEIERLVGARL
jgi:hypothetical protein